MCRQYLSAGVKMEGVAPVRVLGKARREWTRAVVVPARFRHGCPAQRPVDRLQGRAWLVAPEPVPAPARVRGFTLVELLLAVALLGLLMGAVAFNFSTLQRGSRLEEGANQLEALLRFCRAQAAATGHRIRINFEEDVGEGLLVPLGNLTVTWEPDPLQEPGIFAPLPEATSFLESILDLISIEEVRPPGVPAATLGELTAVTPDETAPSSSTLTVSAAAGSDVENDDLGGAPMFAPVTFHPDGSSDSVEITIAPRDDGGEDARRMVLRLAGLTGTIRRRTVVVEDPDRPVSTSSPAKAPKRSEAPSSSTSSSTSPSSRGSTSASQDEEELEP